MPWSEGISTSPLALSVRAPDLDLSSAVPVEGTSWLAAAAPGYSSTTISLLEQGSWRAPFQIRLPGYAQVWQATGP